MGAAYHVLSAFAERGVNLLAFTAVPSGPDRAQFALFPDDPAQFTAEARMAQIAVEGPHHALLVQGDDELGRLAGIHERLFKAGVDVYASTGVSDGRGSFGYVVYVREDQFELALARSSSDAAPAAAMSTPRARVRCVMGEPARHVAAPSSSAPATSAGR